MYLLRSEGDDKVLLVSSPEPSSHGYRCVFCRITTTNFSFLCRHLEEEHGLILRDKDDPDINYGEDDDNDEEEVPAGNAAASSSSAFTAQDPKLHLAVVKLQRLNLALAECPVKLDELDEPLCDPSSCAEFPTRSDASMTKPSAADEADVEMAEDQSLDAEEEVSRGVEERASEKSVKDSRPSGKVLLTKDKIVYLQRWLFYNQKV